MKLLIPLKSQCFKMNKTVIIEQLQEPAIKHPFFGNYKGIGKSHWLESTLPFGVVKKILTTA
jgi:hypothetical protein